MSKKNNVRDKKKFEIGMRTWRILRFMFFLVVGFSIINFLIPVTAVFSQKTTVVFSGEVDNLVPSNIDNTYFFDVIISEGQVIKNVSANIKLHDGDVIRLERNFDFVTVPYIYDPVTKTWEEFFVDGQLVQTLRVDSPRSGAILYQPSALLGGVLAVLLVGFVNGARHKELEK